LFSFRFLTISFPALIERFSEDASLSKQAIATLILDVFPYGSKLAAILNHAYTGRQQAYADQNKNRRFMCKKAGEVTLKNVK